MLTQKEGIVQGFLSSSRGLAELRMDCRRELCRLHPGPYEGLYTEVLPTGEGAYLLAAFVPPEPGSSGREVPRRICVCLPSPGSSRMIRHPDGTREIYRRDTRGLCCNSLAVSLQDPGEDCPPPGRRDYHLLSWEPGESRHEEFRSPARFRMRKWLPLSLLFLICWIPPAVAAGEIRRLSVREASGESGVTEVPAVPEPVPPEVLRRIALLSGQLDPPVLLFLEELADSDLPPVGLESFSLENLRFRGVFWTRNPRGFHRGWGNLEGLSELEITESAGSGGLVLMSVSGILHE